MNMKDIVIYGAGAYGRELACLLMRINNVAPTWNLIGFIDDVMDVGSENEYGKVLGGLSFLNSYEKDLCVIMAIGQPQAIKKLTDSITNTHISFPNIFAPDVIILDQNNFKIGKGNVFCSGCLISCNAQIGNYNSFNDFVSIGHDTSIGNYNAFMTASRLSGHVSIGDCNFFGVNSCMVQGVRVGNNTTLAAGSALIRRTRDGYTYIGVPASPLIIKK